MRAVGVGEEVVRLERPALAVAVLRRNVARGGGVEEVQPTVPVGVVDELVDVLVLRVGVGILRTADR